MKVFFDLGKKIVLYIFLFGILTACVNEISEMEEDTVNDITYPFRFVAEIQEIANTRVDGNTFEVGDSVGLFALSGATSMKEERYADNQCFVRSSGGEFVSEDSMSYPDDGTKLNLISYHPYQKRGVAMGASTMRIMVEPEQNNPKNYSRSDFLIAYKTDVTATKEPISLTYKHKFFKLKLALVPGEGEVVEDLLVANPQLAVSGFFTKTIYDFQEDSYTDYWDEKDIIPAGEWKVEDGRLVGKQFILIPQETTDSYQYVTLNIKGKIYNTLLPSTLKLQSGKQRELEITFRSDEDVLMGKVKGEIEDWEGTETDSVESETVRKYVDISKLTFDNSNVCKIMCSGHQVAEVCKEYIVASGFSSQAIVAYPMKADGHVADLSEGIVVRLLDQSGKVQGGRVSWNVADNSLTYTPGTSVVRNYIYVLPDGQLSLSASMADEALPVSVGDDVIRDVRGGQIHNYPIVKIGAQYWMRTNLEASQYVDGAAILKLKDMVGNGNGYLLSDIGNYYYSVSAIPVHQLSPAGWSLPNWNDWNLLKKYLNNDASLLKSGKWVSIMTDKGPSVVANANNRSGFNAVPVGMYLQAYLPSVYEGRYLSYWTLNADGVTVDTKTFTLRSDGNEMLQGATGADRAYVIRCIRK